MKLCVAYLRSVFLCGARTRRKKLLWEGQWLVFMDSGAGILHGG